MTTKADNNKAREGILFLFSILIFVCAVAFLWGRFWPVAFVILTSLVYLGVWGFLIYAKTLDKHPTASNNDIKAMLAYVFIAASLVFITHKINPLWGVQYEEAKKYEEIKKTLRNEEIALMGKSQKAIEAQLKDPSSVLYRNEFNRNGNIRCGEFNAKNSLGGYAGYQRYIFSRGVLFTAENTKDFLNKWQELCR